MPGNLVVLDLNIRDDRLECEVERYDPRQAHDFLKVSWNANRCPRGYVSAGNGVVYVYVPTNYDHNKYRANPDTMSQNEFAWTEQVRGEGLMLAIVFPKGFGIDRTTVRPIPMGSKTFKNRLAVYWLYDQKLGEQSRVSWQMVPLHPAHLVELSTSLNRDIATRQHSANGGGPVILENHPSGKGMDLLLHGAAGILQEAIEKVPAVKYALGIAGIAAALSIILGLTSDWRMMAVGLPLMFVLMVALVVFSRFAKASQSEVRPLATLFGWWLTLFFIIAMSLVSAGLFTSYFFSWPRSLGSKPAAHTVEEATRGTEELLPLLQRRANAYVNHIDASLKYIEENRDQLLANLKKDSHPAPELELNLQRITLLTTRSRFLEMHKEYVEALRASKHLLAHEIVKDIHYLMQKTASLLSASAPQGGYNRVAYSDDLIFNPAYLGPRPVNLRSSMTQADLDLIWPQNRERIANISFDQGRTDRIDRQWEETYRTISKKVGKLEKPNGRTD